MKYFASILLLCFLSTFAQAADLKVEEVTSSSGVKAWLVRDDKLPLIAMKFVWRGGVEQDPVDKQGLATLTADLLTEGAGPYDAHAFQQRLADQSIQLGFAAGRDGFSGSLKTLRETRAEAFDLLRLALMQPRFESSELERARARQLAALRATMGSPEWQARFALFGRLYKNHPYSYRSLGSMQSLASLTTADVRSFAANHFARDNLVVAVAGAISPKELAQLLDKVFGKLPATAKLNAIPDTTWPDETLRLGLLREGTQTNVLWALPGPRRNDPDWYAVEIANYILGGGGFASRLMKAVRDDKGLTYGIGTSLVPVEHGGAILGSMATENAKTGRAFDLVLQVWQSYFESGPSEDEVRAAKEYLMGALPLALTSTDKIAGFLIQMQLDHLSQDYLVQRKKLLEQVTTADVRRVLDRWFDPSHMIFSMVGAPEGVAFTERQELIRE